MADSTVGRSLQIVHAQKLAGMWSSFAHCLCMPPSHASHSKNSSPSFFWQTVQYTSSSAPTTRDAPALESLWKQVGRAQGVPLVRSESAKPYML